MILFRLEKKTGFSSCFFTTGHTLMFNHVQRRILVNQILVYRKAVKFRSLSFPIIDTLRGVMIFFRWKKKKNWCFSQYIYDWTQNHFNCILRRILVNHIFVYRKQLNSDPSVFQY
jgi:3-methyladenine DNA glycosylase AlkD